MRIKLATPLIGEFPRYSDVKLPDNAAVTAHPLLTLDDVKVHSVNDNGIYLTYDNTKEQE